MKHLTEIKINTLLYIAEMAEHYLQAGKISKNDSIKVLSDEDRVIVQCITEDETWEVLNSENHGKVLMEILEEKDPNK